MNPTLKTSVINLDDSLDHSLVVLVKQRKFNKHKEKLEEDQMVESISKRQHIFTKRLEESQIVRSRKGKKLSNLEVLVQGTSSFL